MKINKTSIFSWIVVLWISKVFLLSLPYKFTGHPDTQHIFGTIGEWMKGVIAEPVGQFFSNFGAYIVGSVELIAVLILLLPALFFALRKAGLLADHPSIYLLHGVGGALASVVMAGAVFFHLFTPLGIEVIHQGKSDGGSLFYAAVSILLLGALMALLNLKKDKKG